MKVRLFAVSGVLVAGAALISGCAFNPESMPITERDRAVYVDAEAPQSLAVKENRAKVAVSTSVGVYKGVEPVAESLDSALTARLSSFAFFEMADRKSAAALIKEKVATSDDPTAIDFKQVAADFLVVGRIASLTVAASPTQQGAYKIDVQFDFKWLSVESQKVVLTKSIRPVVRNALNAGEVNALLSRAAERAAREFCTAISAKYAPPARVLQTRGGGEAARISIGRNYGLSENAEVCFFEFVDNSDVGGEKRSQNDVAKGVVKSVEEKSAWVEVKDFEKVNVRRGTYVRVLEQKKTFGAAFMEQSGLNEALGQ